MHRRVVRDVAEHREEMDERAGRAAHDGAVGVGAPLRLDAVLETFAVEVVGEDGGLHRLVHVFVVCLYERLEVCECLRVAWVIGHNVRDLRGL